ncbi:MAG: hypothetical protein OXC72_02995 [Roseovarius sp.]|nr:hypothetical protein [Roseovarius sp.]
MTKPSGGNTCHVRPADEERKHLREIVDGGMGAPLRRKRAHILLLADRGREDGGRIDSDIASVPDVSIAGGAL